MKRILTIFALVIGATSAAHAGLLLEPYAGYGMSDNTAKLRAGSDNDSTMNGVGYGLRLGYTAPLLFWLAADYCGNKGTVEYGANKVSQDGTHTALGATLGIDLPIFLRAWVGYNFSDKFLAEGNNSTVEFEGNSKKAGIGFTFLPFVSINVEYIMATYDNASGGGMNGLAFGTKYTKVESNTTMVSISLPLDL